MNAITEERGGGKTSHLIVEVLLSDDGVLVVRSHEERQRIIGNYPALKGRVYTFDDFPNRARMGRRHNAPVFVDDADDFLRRYFGNVTTFSYTPDRH